MLAIALVILAPASARADGGAWLWFEYRLPVSGLPPDLPRLSLRIWSDTRFHVDAGGLTQQFLRVGPLVDVTPWLFVAAHATVYADRRPGDVFDQEARLELEPNLHGRIGHFTFNDRNRLEYRWRASQTRVRYRNQLRVNYAPTGARAIPYLWDEVLFDTKEGFNENRLMVGPGWMLNGHTRIDVGYLLRSRRGVDAWTHSTLR